MPERKALFGPQAVIGKRYGVAAECWCFCTVLVPSYPIAFRLWFSAAFFFSFRSLLNPSLRS
jgi:hypothetical protein